MVYFHPLPLATHLDFSILSSGVHPALHAARGDRAEAQLCRAAPLHPRPQRQDLPVPGGQRLGAGGRAQGGEGAATP